MKRARFSDEQIVRILRETDKDTVVEVAKRHGVSEPTIYAWRKKFGDLETDEVRRLKTLEAENARLRKLLVDRDLEIEVMKEINRKKVVSVQARLEQAHYAIGRGVGQRRACTLMQVARSGLYYERKMPSRDLPVIDVMKRLSGQYPRFGSRRIRVFLAREGLQMGKERCSRLWSQAGLQVPAKKKRRRAIASAAPRPKMPDQRNTVWSYDFVYDACANGQTIKCLTVVDEYTRECLAIDVAGSIRSKRVVDVLSKLINVQGAPRYLRSYNGPEFVATKLLEWALQEKLESVLIDPGKPWQNGTNESFNGKFRDECLSMEWFRNRLEARVIIEDWRQHYNSVRPHSSLNYLTPNEFVAGLQNNLSTETGKLSSQW